MVLQQGQPPSMLPYARAAPVSFKPMLHHDLNLALSAAMHRDPLTVKALAKESKIDPDFRRQMWALVSQRQQQEWQRARKRRTIEETNSPV